MQTWRQLEQLVDLGLVRHIGTSNMTIPKLELLLRDARIKPAVNEMELHPHFQQPALFDFVRATASSRSATAPSARRRGRNATAPPTTRGHRRPGDRAHCGAAGRASGGGLHQVGGAARPDADPLLHQRRNYLANLQGVVGEPLTDAEMAAIAGIDKGCRLIKGQVFLWKEGQDWRDLWDEDGVING
jgi:alcohol dehydrogenase (NADP+)